MFLIWCKNLTFLHLYSFTDKYHYYENYSLYYSFEKLEWLVKKKLSVF